MANRRRLGTPARSPSPWKLMKILNVGGGSKDIPLPPAYAAVEQILLDIAPGPGVDIVADPRTHKFKPEFDVVFCSHNLEHYYAHETIPVLRQFYSALVVGGILHVKVPDIGKLMKLVVDNELELDDVLYHAPVGPIMVQDVIYGWGDEIERSGEPFYAHKTGFTLAKLGKCIGKAGFRQVQVFQLADSLELEAMGLKV